MKLQVGVSLLFCFWFTLVSLLLHLAAPLYHHLNSQFLPELSQFGVLFLFDYTEVCI